MSNEVLGLKSQEIKDPYRHLEGVMETLEERFTVTGVLLHADFKTDTVKKPNHPLPVKVLNGKATLTIELNLEMNEMMSYQDIQRFMAKLDRPNQSLSVKGLSPRKVG